MRRNAQDKRPLPAQRDARRPDRTEPPIVGSANNCAVSKIVIATPMAIAARPGLLSLRERPSVLAALLWSHRLAPHSFPCRSAVVRHQNIAVMQGDVDAVGVFRIDSQVQQDLVAPVASDGSEIELSFG